jgi:hypothetical protein
MSEYLRNLVKQIQKEAQVPSRSKGPKATSTPAPAATNTAPAQQGTVPAKGNVPQRGQAPAPQGGVGGGGGGGGGGGLAVKEMQRALMELAKAVTAQINVAPKPGANADPRAEQEAKSRNSFHNFITKTFLTQSDVPGVEFDPDETKTEMKDKDPSDPSRMGVLMNTMNRVGNPRQGEKFDDGNWGPRTQAALRNAYAFAYAMLQLAKEYNLTKVTAYNSAALGQFRVSESEKDIPAQEKPKYAEIYTKHIKAILNMFKQIRQNILEKPAYQEFIEGDKPYATFDQDKGGEKPGQAPVAIDPQAMASMQKRFEKGFPVLFYNVQTRESQTVPVLITDLTSPQALQDWQYRNQTGMDASEILRQVKDRLAGRPIRPIPSKYEDTLPQADRDRLAKNEPKPAATEQTEQAQETQVGGV